MTSAPFSPRTPVHTSGGVVATSQPQAARAGAAQLSLGGNAIDAAVAAALALAVTEPVSCGLGGDCFALVYDAGEITALDGSGAAPAGLTLERLAAAGCARELPPRHALTITVPGAVRGLCDLLACHGTRSREAVFAPAIALAEEGCSVGPITAQAWGREAAALRAIPGGSQLLLADGRAPAAGEAWRNPGLARVLRAIASDGPAAYYEGPIARAIATVVQGAGGVLAEADLAVHASRWGRSIALDYRGVRVHEHPPAGQGIAALIALGILEAREAWRHPWGSPARLHETIEALRLAFADARAFVADPARAAVPVAGLLERDYLRARAAQIDPARAARDPRAGAPDPASHTVYVAAVDGAGRACSLIFSNYMGTGTGIAPDGLGFTLHNRGLGFSLDPAHPNAVAPGKRPYHTIIPALATRADGSLLACFGVMGGFMQPQGHVQVLQALLDDGCDPQAALDRPRWCLRAGEAAGVVALEEGIEPALADALRARGHTIEHPIGGWERALFGRGQVIVRDPDGALRAGSDPRADGCAIAVEPAPR